jgi:hypothetical protein
VVVVLAPADASIPIIPANSSTPAHGMGVGVPTAMDTPAAEALLKRSGPRPPAATPTSPSGNVRFSWTSPPLHPLASADHYRHCVRTRFPGKSPARGTPFGTDEGGTL